MATRVKELANLNPTIRDFLSVVIWGYGKGAPTDATSTAEATGQGEAGIGSLYVDITNGNLYKNTNTKASPTWNQVGGVAASEIVLAEGNVLIGNSSGVGVALDIGATDLGVAIGNGTTATINVLSGDVTMTNAGAVTIADAILEGSNAAVVADANVIGGFSVVHRVLLASGANADVDVALTHKTRIIDAFCVLKGAGTAGSIVTVKNVTTAVSDAMDLSGSDKAIVRAATWDDAQHEIAAAANLRVSYASTGGDFPGAEVYVSGLRVA